MIRCLATAALVAALAAGIAAASAAERLAIFDAHLHYSRDAWQRFDAAAIVAKLEAAGVKGALVSSTPDAGTLKLQRFAPERFLAELRPYRAGIGGGNWFTDAATPDYLTARLPGAYVGIGEFHLPIAKAARTPVLASVVALARQHDILLHVHASEGPVRALIKQAADLRILWAHAGFSDHPDVITEMLESFAKLWAEVSFRAADIAPGGRIDADWEAMFKRFPERFLIGSDTYVTARWEHYGELIEEHRKWLGQLPPALAKAIAHGNAERLFGPGPRR